MNLNEAMRTGLPIAIGGAMGRHPDDREDMIEEAMLPTLAQQGVVEESAPEEQFTEQEPPSAPDPVPPAAPGSLEAEVDAILHRIEGIEQRMRERLGLHRIHGALDRLDALLS